MRKSSLLLLMLLIHPALAQPRQVIESHCYDCHQGEEAKAGVDLSRLWTKDAKANAKLWTRVERMVAAGRMPPKDAGALPAADRKRILDWYRDQFVLRDGRPHIGTTPLRRLTRYELENTLEQLLGVSLKRPYARSPESAGLLPSTIEQLYPADIQGPSGFDNDAHQQQSVKIPVLKYIDCLDYALRMFDQNDSARRRLLGFEERPKEMTAKRAHEVLRRFCRRAWRGPP